MKPLKPDGESSLRQVGTLAADALRRSSVDPSFVLGFPTPDIRDLYVFGRILGQGKSGTTYLCTESATGVEYACKSISKHNLISMEDVQREIVIMQHLYGQRNVVKIKDTYEDTLGVHIVMELCAGGELFDRILQWEHYSESRAAKVTRTIVGVIQKCHSLGIVHRDLKPENFLLVNKDDDLSIKAINFGLSVFFKPGDFLTDVVGSPYYLAPEVLLKHYGQEAEIWTAGVILYILLSGVPPFWAETQEGIVNNVLKGEVQFDADPWPTITESAKDLIKQMLCSCPSVRLTARAVLNHPWISEDGVAPDEALDPIVLTRLKQFSAVNKFKKIDLQVVAEMLSEVKIVELRKMLKVMDTKSSDDTKGPDHLYTAEVSYEGEFDGSKQCGPHNAIRHVGVGGIIRNKIGLARVEFSRSLSPETMSTEAETLALLSLVRFACDSDLFPLEIRGDDEVAITALEGRVTYDKEKSESGEHIKEALKLLQGKQWSGKWIRSYKNKEAHRLAKAAMRRSRDERN